MPEVRTSACCFIHSGCMWLFTSHSDYNANFTENNNNNKNTVYSFALTSHTNDGVNPLTPMQICPFALKWLGLLTVLVLCVFPFQILDEFKKDSSVFILGWGTSSGVWLFRGAELVIGALGGSPSPASGSGRVASVGGPWGRGLPIWGLAMPTLWHGYTGAVTTEFVTCRGRRGGPKVL